MSEKRPVNLAITTIRFPMPAIVSILHRISGVLMFFSVPLLLWILRESLATRIGFYQIQAFIMQPWMRFVLWVVLSCVIYHVVAGIRHLLMDIGIGESLSGGRAMAKITLILSIILIVLAGVWLW